MFLALCLESGVREPRRRSGGLTGSSAFFSTLWHRLRFYTGRLGFQLQLVGKRREDVCSTFLETGVWVRFLT